MIFNENSYKIVFYMKTKVNFPLKYLFYTTNHCIDKNAQKKKILVLI